MSIFLIAAMVGMTGWAGYLLQPPPQISSKPVAKVYRVKVTPVDKDTTFRNTRQRLEDML